MSNRSSGNAFEMELCQILADHGWWAHCMKQSAAGQPADVIAAKDGKPVLIDCKICMSNRFSFERIEMNQYLAMRLWHSTGNGQGWFAIKMYDHIFMLPLSIIEHMENSGLQSINYEKLKLVTKELEEWLKEV